MELSYQTLKFTHQCEMRREARRKNLLILISHYLTQEGYIDTANALEQETKLGLRRFEVCDNIDLETILMEYESYYFVKFQKYPKIVKKSSDTAENNLPQRSGGKTRRMMNDSCQNLPKINQQRPRSKTTAGKTGDTKSLNKEHPNQEVVDNTRLESANFGLHISRIRKDSGEENAHPRRGQIIDFQGLLTDAIKGATSELALNTFDHNPDPSERLLKPLSAFIGMNSEMRELAAVVSRDIYLHNPNIKWNDIIGLDAAKQLVKEAVVYPIRYPQLFTGILSPWKGLLLYGPPGTGKTLLAKAVATECKTTFFNISASTIVSKWRGDSEKLVRVLFELARYHAPSTIFLDELESVMSQRGTAPGGEHEGSLRMKTELLVQMDGLAHSEDLVFVLAASNLPWELDCAMLRRLEKRILVDLPSREARQAMIYHWLPPVSKSRALELHTELEYSVLSQGVAEMLPAFGEHLDTFSEVPKWQETEGYSGSDIKLVCREAAMRPVRKIFDALENHQSESSDLPRIQLDIVTTADFLDVLTHTKPSAKNLAQRYSDWQREFESV
ncbi:katanin p60 ATPase-containing subunit A-like 2 isoform X3 [Gorilla gorilla gorilla]|uniref:katanin p60 ATPase-containing subunit A-like 2 isoform X3 n=1 Tax=Gorilla gorilla gorilla TaxID=9595 RepID=UPI0024458B0A|nr:katanin p60 ATPase-containing subunit A-like 2 isoform X3 [Gorilla gorilla gorilla]XP_055224759.1 katanin p60 ATPase-containing subunit A-like 2 isoform X3 [Gorilla gorilla gorilla]